MRQKGGDPPMDWRRILESEVLFPNPEVPRRRIVEGLRAFLDKTGLKGFVLGMSGGVDSSLTAALAVEAVGPEKVRALLMPELGLSSPEGIRDAEEWAKALGIRYTLIPINGFLKPLSGIPWRRSETAVMNAKPRIRMLLLYDLANSEGLLVLGTGNRTELLLGYFTKHGDGACDLLPIGDLYKSQVWQLAEHVGVPERIVKKVPSAELAPGQTDEGEMGLSYRMADVVLHLCVDKGQPPERAVEAGIPRSTVERVLARLKANEHKRKPPFVIKAR